MKKSIKSVYAFMESKPKKKWYEHEFYTQIAEDFAHEFNNSGILTESDNIRLTGKMLNEAGFWDTVQSKVGNFAGGIQTVLKKVGVSKEPESYTKAKELFDKVIKKNADSKVSKFIDEMEKEIKDLESSDGSGPKDQDFPVNKTSNYFISGLVSIASFYDSLVAATKKKPEDEGFMPVEAANALIEQLRLAVEKYIEDVSNLKGGMYVSFGGGGAKTGDVKTGSQKESMSSKDFDEFLFEIHKLVNAKMPLVEQAEGDANKVDKSEVKEPLSDEEKEYLKKVSKADYKENLQKFTSLKWPLIFLGVGSALGAAGILLQMKWVQDYIIKIFTKHFPGEWDEQIREMESHAESQGFNFKGGITQGCSKLMKAQGIDYPDMGKAGSKMGDFPKFLESLGKTAPDMPGSNMDKGMRIFSLSGSGDGSQAGFEKAMKGVKEMLKAASDNPKADYNNFIKPGGDFAGGLGATKGYFSDLKTGKLWGTITKPVIKHVAKKIIITDISKGVSIALKVKATGAVLASIGIPVAVAAGTVALIRQRAKSKSRLALLTDLKGQLVDLVPPPVEVEPQTDPEDVNVDIELTDPASGGSIVGTNMPAQPSGKPDKGALNAGRIRLADVLFEDTSVTIKGLKGDGVDPKGSSVTLPTIDSEKIPPRIKDPDDLPTWVNKELKKSLKGLDLDSAKVTVTDKRTDKSKAETEPKPKPQPKPEPITPPVPVPKPTDNKSFAVAVFTGPKGVQVYRVLKKKTLARYKSGAKSAKDLDSEKLFSGMVDKYDASINALRSAGLIVNDKKIQTAIGNISTGKDGTKTEFDYSRKGKTVKSKTGGFTQMKTAKTTDEIRNNILGADGKRVKDAASLSIVYLVSNNVVQSIARSAKVGTEEARNIVAKVIKMWAKNKKAPKADKIEDIEDAAKAALKKNGLAESVNRNKVNFVEFDKKTLLEALNSIAANRDMERWAMLAGI